MNLARDDQSVLIMRTVTMAFDPTEDRVFMDASDSAGQVERLWLSRRLLDRLIPALTGQLEKLVSFKDETISNAAIQSFAQEKAVLEKAEQSPISKNENSTTWLVTSVQVGQSNNKFQLRFVNEQGVAKEKTIRKRGVFTLEKPNLRQWLNAVFNIYKKAEWNTGVFPDWIDDSNSSAQPSLTIN